MVEAVGSWPGAVWIQQSGTAYLFVSAAHILGIALLLGSILPLDLRMLGFFRKFPVDVLEPFLVRCAAAGLGVAVLTGLWLFSVKPDEYLLNDAFRWKLLLIALAVINVVIRYRAFKAVNRVSAGLSLSLWLSVLIAGRWIGFL